MPETRPLPATPPAPEASDLLSTIRQALSDDAWDGHPDPLTPDDPDRIAKVAADAALRAVTSPSTVPASAAGPHRLVVARDGAGYIVSIRFICDAGDGAPCHTWPSCSCEIWTRDLHGQVLGQVIGRDQQTGHLLYADRDIAPAPGHEAVHQALCWADPWLNIDMTPDEWAELYTGEKTRVPHPDGGMHDDLSWLVPGPIQVTFEGDYVSWEYADDPSAGPGF